MDGSVPNKGQPHFSAKPVLEFLNQAKFGNIDFAEVSCRAHLQHNTSDGFAHNALGLILCKAKKYDQAIQSFRDATRCPGPLPIFFMHLSAALFACYRNKESLAVVESAYQTWPDIFQIRLALAVSYANCFNGAAARDIFSDILSRDPENPKVLVHFARAMFGAGMTIEAVNACEKAIATEPTSFKFLGLYFSNVLAVVGRTSESKEIRARFISLYGGAEREELKELDLLERSGLAIEAEKYWTAKLDKEGISIPILLNLATNKARQAQWDEAINYIHQARDLPVDKKSQIQMQALARTVIAYRSRVEQLALVPPQAQRQASEDMIVVRGALERSFVHVAQHYRAAHPNIFIILSTWSDTATDILDDARPYFDDIVLNARPPLPGNFNINYQITCAANGVSRARQLGASRILVTRTDIALLKANLIGGLSETLENDHPNHTRTPGLSKRLIICDLQTQVHPFYHASDIFCYGTVDDVSNYWSLDHLTDTCLAPEVILCRALARKVGRVLTFDLSDSLAAIRDLFIVRDAQALELYWPKYPRATSSPIVGERPYVTEKAWRGEEQIEISVLEEYLPRIE